MTSPMPQHPSAQRSALLVWRAGHARDAAVTALKSAGIVAVETVENAVQGFALLAKHAPRLIFAEAENRPTTGLIFIKELRATTVPSRDAPAVIVSARGHETLAEEARRAGADGVAFGRVTPEAVAFWLSCTEADVRTVIECAGYRGPDRRTASPSPQALVQERRRAPARAADDRDPIITSLSEACLQATRWGETGDPAPLAIALEALSEAKALAHARAEISLTRSLENAAIRMRREAESWDADPASLLTALGALKEIAQRRASGQEPGAPVASMESP
jgi:CheY-like chemotaxis protein